MKIVGVRLGEDHLNFLEDAAQVAPSVWWRSRGFKPSDILRKALNDFMSGDGKERAEFLQEIVKQKKEIRGFRLTPAAAAVKRSAGPAVKHSFCRQNVKQRRQR